MLVVLMLVKLSGCAFFQSKYTPEERAYNKKTLDQVSSFIQKHVSLLGKVVCTYHKENGSWPKQTGKISEHNLFQSLSVTDHTDNSFEFQLKIKLLPSPLIIEMSKKPKRPRFYWLNVTGNQPSEDSGVNDRFVCDKNNIYDVEFLKTPSSGAPDKNYLEFSSRHIAKLIDFTSVKNEKIGFLSKENSDTAIMETVCLLLILEPSQCQM